MIGFQDFQKSYHDRLGGAQWPDNGLKRAPEMVRAGGGPL
jgi:hypothetical protein